MALNDEINLRFREVNCSDVSSDANIDIMLRIGQLNKFNFKNKKSAWCCERRLNSCTSLVDESRKLSNSFIIKARIQLASATLPTA